MTKKLVIQRRPFGYNQQRQQSSVGTRTSVLDSGFNGSRTEEATTENMELLTGQRGDGLDKAVTYRDMVSLGLASFRSSGSGGIGDGLLPPDDGGGSGDVDIPHVPRNFQVFSTFSTILLNWAGVVYRGHAYTEIWRHSVDVIGDATLIGTSRSTMYSDVPSLGDGFYYWIRYVNVNGIAGPWSSISGEWGDTNDGEELITADYVVAGIRMLAPIMEAGLAFGSEVAAGPNAGDDGYQPDWPSSVPPEERTKFYTLIDQDGFIWTQRLRARGSIQSSDGRFSVSDDGVVFSRNAANEVMMELNPNTGTFRFRGEVTAESIIGDLVSATSFDLLQDVVPPAAPWLRVGEFSVTNNNTQRATLSCIPFNVSGRFGIQGSDGANRINLSLIARVLKDGVVVNTTTREASYRNVSPGDTFQEVLQSPAHVEVMEQNESATYAFEITYDISGVGGAGANAVVSVAQESGTAQLFRDGSAFIPTNIEDL